MGELLKTMAVYYASRGLRVVPLHGVYARLCTCGNPACRSPAKHPRTMNGLKDGSSDSDVVERMWTRWPFASIGICTGVESGVLVIDLDDMAQVPAVLRSWATDEHPPTWRATTGRGGKHVFFRYDQDRAGIKSRTGVWPKVDVRADGGYVVAAPSPHINGNTYRWDDGCAPADTDLAALPDELEQVLRAGGGTEVDQPVSGPSTGPRIKGPPKSGSLPAPGAMRLHDDEVERIRAALSFIDATGRTEWLYVGMALKSTGAGRQAYDIWTEWSQTVPHKFDDKDQQATWRGLKELLPNGEEITLRKLYWMAKQRGAPDFTEIEVQLVEQPPVDPEPEPVENLPGHGAEPVPDRAEPLPDAFWLRLAERSPLLHEMVEWIARTAPKKQRLLAFGNSLAAIGALLGRRVRSPGNCRTNLYVFGIAGSGRGKEHSRQCIAQLFTAAGLASWIGGDGWKSDSGIRTELLKAPAHLAQLDEFGKTLAAIAAPHAPPHLSGIVKTMLELFGRAGGMDLGPAYADQEKNPRVVILEPCLSVYATSVPNDLFEAMTSRSVADGFLNRWICLFGDERPEYEDLEEPSYSPPPFLVKALQTLEDAWRTNRGLAGVQGNMPGNAPAAHIVPRTPDATVRRREITRRIDDESNMRSDRGDPLSDLWRRVPEITEKVALVLAATRPLRFEARDGGVVPRWDGRPASPAGKDRDGFPVDAHVPVAIERADVELAYDLVSWAFRRFELEVAARVADSDYEAKVKRVLRILLSAGTRGLSSSVLTRKTQWMSSRERDDILKTLADSGQATVSVVAQSKGAGRPLTNYRFAGFGGTQPTTVAGIPSLKESIPSSQLQDSDQTPTGVSVGA